MVCKKCEKRLTTVAAPDPFQPSSSTRKIGENKLLTARARAAPYVKPGAGGVGKGKTNTMGNKCIDCKLSCQQNGAIRCHKCAYKKGLCAICGTIVLDTSRYKQTVK
ncbi:uncharacterized protein MKK02DRAFT_38649 [Dioszegia hungarica]|uniref:Cysteine-rich PDZ-binding protein n=1 Tax=Dioszegia hungarica TaxID=4972 RepID=A0AA38H501_9TREE|nr:uncharacterized protein MKK02DRAFT_38649 [Dioszegia hungarica]KAI9633978.1 hypothetical protein MKK02DRAFT_38649 [Dioszegia hungarica]